MLQSGALARERIEAAEEDVDVVKQAIRTGFLKLDEAMRQMPEVSW